MKLVPVLAGLVCTIEIRLLSLLLNSTTQASHVVYRRHEPRTLAHIVASVSLPLVLFYLGGFPVLSSLIRYWSTLFASICVYRLSPFHPLAKFPGPFLARLSRLHQLAINSKGLDHLHYIDLHARYGDIVRTGPNHLSILHSSAVATILGPRDMWDKGGRPYLSLHYWDFH
jgi:hypothetical protein